MTSGRLRRRIAPRTQLAGWRLALAACLVLSLGAILLGRLAGRLQHGALGGALGVAISFFPGSLPTAEIAA